MEIKSLEELMEEYAREIKVSNFGHSFLRNVFYAGYKARMRQELSLEALSGNKIEGPYTTKKWTLFNFGASYSGDQSFGKYAEGIYVTYNEAKNIPLFRLPTKAEFEYLVRHYIKEVSRNSSSGGWFYNHKIGFKAYSNNPCIAYFYHRTKELILDDGRNIQNIYPELQGRRYVCIWLADEVSEEKAMAVALPMEFPEKTQYYNTYHDLYDGTMLPPIFLELNKKTKLQVHFIFDTEDIKKELEAW
jgi:hypothetical protein